MVILFNFYDTTGVLELELFVFEDLREEVLLFHGIRNYEGFYGVEVPGHLALRNADIAVAFVVHQLHVLQILFLAICVIRGIAALPLLR